MKRRSMLWAAAGVLGALFGALAAQGQSLEEILAKNFEARGGKEKIQAVQSVRFTGRMPIGEGAEAPLILKWKRPNRIRMEFTVQGMVGIQAYDGSAGWMVMPFMGKTDPEAMSQEEVKSIEEMADTVDGPLMDYQTKGHQLELVGKEAVEGTEAYKLKLTKKGGDVSYVYLDAEAFLEIKEEGKHTRRGQEFEFESSSGDYKEVEGLVIAHSIETKAKGAPQGQIITIDKVELNVEIPDSEFAMPEVKKPEEAAKPGH